MKAFYKLLLTIAITVACGNAFAQNNEDAQSLIKGGCPA